MAALVERLAIWRRALVEDDNAVERTVISLAFNHAVFLSIAKSVELAPAIENDRKALNPYVLDLLSTSYWGGVVMAIRRLVDVGSLHGKRGVSSLRSVLRDIQDCRKWLTRRTYIEP